VRFAERTRAPFVLVGFPHCPVTGTGGGRYDRDPSTGSG
jgi:hypothetical protein